MSSSAGKEYRPLPSKDLENPFISNIQEESHIVSNEQDYRAVYFQKKTFEHPLKTKLAFIRKIYSILLIQLIITLIIIFVIYFVDPINDFIRTNLRSHISQSHFTFLFAISISYFVLAMGLLFMMKIFERATPWNLILLFTFTCCTAIYAGVICTFYSFYQILVAATVTFILFCGLTMYTLITKSDFQWLGAFLFIAFLALLLTSLIHVILALVFGIGYWWHFVFSFLGCLLFCGFILYDTSLCLYFYEPDEYITACCNLYLDTINLFLNVLNLTNLSRH